MIPKLNDTQVECICASVTAEKPVTAESLRRLAQELGDQAPPTLRGRLRGVRLRNAEPSLVDIASELGLPCEQMHRNMSNCCILCFPHWSRSGAIAFQGVDVILRNFFGGWTQRLSEVRDPRETR